VLLLVNDQHPTDVKEFIEPPKAYSTMCSFGRLYGPRICRSPISRSDRPLKLRHCDQWRGPASPRSSQQCPVTTQWCRRRWRTSKRQAARAGVVRRQALEIPARCADAQGTGYDVEYYLWVGIFPRGNAAIVTTLRAHQQRAQRGLHTVLTNAGQELAYLDGPDFQKFWDEDGKRTTKRHFHGSR